MPTLTLGFLFLFYVYKYSLPLEPLPIPHPPSSTQVITEHQAKLPVLYSSFPLATYMQSFSVISLASHDHTLREKLFL